MFTVHRPKPVGRIPILVVDKGARKHNIGRMLVEAVEQWCRDQGCGLIEVTSNDRRAEAHAFYRHMGYERSSIRFFKICRLSERSEAISWIAARWLLAMTLANRSIVAPTAESFSSSRSYPRSR